MVEPSYFLEWGNEEDFAAIQYDLLREVVLCDKEMLDGFFMIEFIYIDDEVDVWIFTCNNERLLAYEYALLNIEVQKTLYKLYARLN